MLKRTKGITKFGAVLVLLAMVCSVIPAQAAYSPSVDVWDGSVNENWLAENVDKNGNPITDDSQTRNATLHIRSAADFIAFRNKVVSGTTQISWGGGKYYPLYLSTVILDCDIDLKGLNLKYGVGGWSTGDQFAGIFDGNGHIIKNLSINPNLPDAALVQPAPNPNISAASYETDGTLTGEDSPYMIGLFPYLKGYNQTQSYPSVINLNLEDVEITLPDKFLTSQTQHYVGALCGWFYNGAQIAGCSVKNVTYKGGPSNYTEDVSGKYYNIGGMVGMSQNGTANSIINCYVDGVDFTQLDLPVAKTWTYLSGLFNNSGPTKLQNVYTANVVYDEDKIRNFDSFCYPIGDHAQVISVTRDNEENATNYAFYAETPKRIEGGEEVEVTLNGDYTVGTLTSDAIWRTSYGGSLHMLDMSTFDGSYAKLPSERMVLGRRGSFATEDGSTVTSLSQAGGAGVKATFETLNTTGETQTVNIILAKYQGTELKGVVVDTVSVLPNSFNNERPGNLQWGRRIYNVAKDANNNYTVFTNGGNTTANTTKVTSSLISTEGCDSVRAFMWNSTSDLKILSDFAEIK